MAAVTRVLVGEPIVGVAETSTLSRSTISKYLNMYKATGHIQINKRGPKQTIDVEIKKDIVVWVACMQRGSVAHPP